MVRLTFPAAVVVALVPLGCGGGESSDSTSAPTSTRPASTPRTATVSRLCGPLRTRVTGHVATGAGTELSGLALSRSYPRVLWAHNDSGDRARVLAITLRGRLLADVAVTGAENVDWEDMAIGPTPNGGDALYIGDIGDNDEERPAVVVYRVPEPRPTGGAAATAPAERLALRYPDRPHNAEALLVDPSTGVPVIVTKAPGGVARVYVAPRPATAATTTMRRAGTVSLGAGEEVTAGDVSANGRTIALRTYDRAFIWSRRSDESLAAALRRRPCASSADLLIEGQGEALALTRGGRAFYTVPEGNQPPLRIYRSG